MSMFIISSYASGTLDGCSWKWFNCCWKPVIVYDKQSFIVNAVCILIEHNTWWASDVGRSNFLKWHVKVYAAAVFLRLLTITWKLVSILWLVHILHFVATRVNTTLQCNTNIFYFCTACRVHSLHSLSISAARQRCEPTFYDNII